MTHHTAYFCAYSYLLSKGNRYIESMTLDLEGDDDRIHLLEYVESVALSDKAFVTNPRTLVPRHLLPH